MEEVQFRIDKKRGKDFIKSFQSNKYTILLFEGKGKFLLDFCEYSFNGRTALFFSPCQSFEWKADQEIEINELSFHGDFYCIEYHKKEVACNGLLFNNIYLKPHVVFSKENYSEMITLLGKIEKEIYLANSSHDFSDAILRSYLQLLLALCSREKKRELSDIEQKVVFNQETNDIQNLFDSNFLKERSASFYADALAISSSSLTKKTKQLFGKTPTQLIQDRVILEAKKLLHLTQKSVKEISAILNFDDEFYFSRYFKKYVGLSPLHYREQVGISIVAKLSMN